MDRHGRQRLHDGPGWDDRDPHARLSGLRVHVPQAAPHTPALVHLAALLEAGTVTPVIDRRYDLAHTADALEYVEREHARAKVVITTQPTKGHVDDNV